MPGWAGDKKKKKRQRLKGGRCGGAIITLGARTGYYIK